MGSSNGVYVRDQKVDDAILQEGDTFAIGDAFIRILEDEIPPTLSMPSSEATVFERASRAHRAALPPRPVPAEPAFAVGDRLVGSPAGGVHLSRRAAAPRVLGVASIAVGMALLLATLFVGDGLGPAGILLGLAGFMSVVAGLARFTHPDWSRKLSYFVFAVWALTCVLAPFGAMGLAYQLRGEERPETDSFFSVVLGLTALIGLAGIIAATVLAHLYIPGPVPV